jgi:hypothetical protein
MVLYKLTIWFSSDIRRSANLPVMPLNFEIISEHIYWPLRHWIVIPVNLQTNSGLDSGYFTRHDKLNLSDQQVMISEINGGHSIRLCSLHQSRMYISQTVNVLDIRFRLQDETQNTMVHCIINLREILSVQILKVKKFV